MDLYIVRHGQTKANTRHIYQRPNEPITREGSAEIARLVRTVTELQPTHLYTSHFARARQTAHYLSYATELEAQWLPLVSELYPPEHLFGKRHYGLTSLVYLLRWFFHALKKGVEEKAETRAEFTKRLFDAREFFEAHEDADRIVVVTHSVFANFFVAHLCTNRELSVWRAVPLFLKIVWYENAGITHVEYQRSDDARRCGWRMRSFNQHQHLHLED